MPRKSREKSNSGYLHIIMKGIGSQLLFEEKDDYYYFLSRMKKYATESNVLICAYCLMDNHVHMLINDSLGNSALFVKRLGVSYSLFFNKKYERSGHLFQNRYKSEAVEDDKYFLAVFKYILRNPEKAGIAKATDYQWNSYKDYVFNKGITDSSSVKGIIDRYGGIDWLLSKKDLDESREMEFEPIRHSDKWALDKAREVLKVNHAGEISNYAKAERNMAIKVLYNSGISISQIARITGLGRNVVRYAVK